MQSVERAFELLELLTDAGGSQGLTQLASASGLPLPTVHRLLATLAQLGYVRREPSRRYSLGPRLTRIGEAASRAFGQWARPSLRRLVEMTGETANLAALDSDAVVYVAQAPSSHSMRMFTEPGRKAFLHSTGVGKALLAQLPDSQVRMILERTGLPAQTPHTITDLDVLLAELVRTRERGYAVDDDEQEIGVRCVAVAVRDVPGRFALSVSGPHSRMTETLIRDSVPKLAEVARELGATLREGDGWDG